MDAPVVEVRYPTPPKVKLIPDDELDMATPVVRYPTPQQRMTVAEELLDDEGRPVDYARSVGRYPTHDPRPAAAPLAREVEHIDPADLGESDLDEEEDNPPAPATAAAASSSRRTRVRGGNGQ